MAHPALLPPPELVEFEGTTTTGQDLLGLRLSVQNLGEHWLGGITTITPTLRYVSFETWLLWRYLTAEPSPPDSSKAFRRFAIQAEAAFVMANLTHDRSTGGLIGSDKGKALLAEEDELWILERLVKQPAVSTYARAIEQLGLIELRAPRAPKLDSRRGLALAQAVDAVWGETALASRMATGEPLEMVQDAELEEFGRVAWVNAIPEVERAALLDAILPPAPNVAARRRMATYALLLQLAVLDGAVNEAALLDEALRPEPRVPAVLRPALDGWLQYAVRDVIAVTGEATLASVVRALDAQDPMREGVQEDTLVHGLLEATWADQERALAELGLLEPDEDAQQLGLRQLARRVVEALEGEEGTVVRDGLRRWSGRLNEAVVQRAVPGLGDGAPTLAIVAWLIVDHRAGEGVREGRDELAALSARGSRRFGLAEVVLPRVARWRTEDTPFPEGLTEFVHRVIAQHLHIAWARLANASDKAKRDVAVAHRDGQRLLRHADYSGGRSQSRVSQGLGWLRQLRLIDEAKITEDGAEVLEGILATLEEA